MASDGVTIGLILMGMAKPVHIVTAISSVRRIVNMVALAAVDAQNQAAQKLSKPRPWFECRTRRQRLILNGQTRQAGCPFFMAALGRHTTMRDFTSASRFQPWRPVRPVPAILAKPPPRPARSLSAADD